MKQPTMRVPGGRIHAVDLEFRDEYGPVGFLCGLGVYSDDAPSEEPPTCGNCLRVLRMRAPTDSNGDEER